MPDLQSVVIFETDDPMALALAKGALEEADIPYVAANQITKLMNDIDPMLRKWVKLEVATDREAEAREILAAVLQPLPEE
jgi:hypothetical protein